MALSKRERRLRIRRRIKKRVKGTSTRPRLSVFRSNKNIYVQLIDDINGKTLGACSSKEKDIADKNDITKTVQAGLVGEKIALKAKEIGIETIVFDRGGYLYHGRIKALAESARKAGLKF